MDELQFRQAVRNIDKVLRWNVVIPRRKRSSLERYRQHPNERVRAYVERIFALDAYRRAEYLAEREPFEESACIDVLEGGPSTDELSWIEVQQDCIELFQDGELAWDVWVANGPDGPIQDDTEPELP